MTSPSHKDRGSDLLPRLCTPNNTAMPRIMLNKASQGTTPSTPVHGTDALDMILIDSSDKNEHRKNRCTKII